MTLYELEENALPPPRFPEPRFSSAHVIREPGVGYLLVSHLSGRQFFCAEGTPCVQTQFSGSVSRCYEARSLVAMKNRGLQEDRVGYARREEEEAQEEEEEEGVSDLVAFAGQTFRYWPSRVMALKTCCIASLKLEGVYQGCEIGELSGEDPVKEMAALQLLQSHGNVEELEEAMADGTTLYKVTPWYEGGELFDLAPMPEHSAKAVFAQLLDALDFIHSRGVCHRDISLENILMDTRMPKRGSASRSSSVSSIGSCVSVASSTGFSEAGFDSRSESENELRKATDAGRWIGRPRLCDFGMSVRIPNSTTTGKMAPVTPQGRCGKNTCVAPEVFYDQAFDAQAVDLWSLGTTLFMALLGVQPWEEVGDYKFQAIAEGKNLEVVLEGWKLRDAISQDAVDLLQAMLTADPEERMSDIKSILAHPWFQQ